MLKIKHEQTVLTLDEYHEQYIPRNASTIPHDIN
uniref:Uncharacterized protein n=1 Tax=Arundo donax TaxID=35708 RepID=A0A0A9HK41_ARUDO